MSRIVPGLREALAVVAQAVALLVAIVGLVVVVPLAAYGGWTLTHGDGCPTIPHDERPAKPTKHAPSRFKSVPCVTTAPYSGTPCPTTPTPKDSPR